MIQPEKDGLLSRDGSHQKINAAGGMHNPGKLVCTPDRLVRTHSRESEGERQIHRCTYTCREIHSHVRQYKTYK
jgi:hypothetical protein